MQNGTKKEEARQERSGLTQGAIRTTATDITHASYVFLGIPRLSVSDIGCGPGLQKCVLCGLLSELRLGEAYAGIAAPVRADGALASNTFIVLEASTLSGLSVARTLIGALHYRVGVIGIHYRSDPSLGPEN